MGLGTPAVVRLPERVRAKSLTLGTVGVTALTLAAASAWTSPATTGDRVQIVGVRRGQLIHRPVQSSASSSSIRSGAALMARGDLALRMLAVEPTEAIVLSVPAGLFSAGPALAAGDLVLLPAHSLMVAPVLAFAATAAHIESTDMSGVEHYFVERLLQEMAVAMSLNNQQTAHVPREQPLFERALAIVAARSADRSLTAASVAHDLSVSLRHLERVLAEHGTTLRRELRRARVDHATALLRDSAYAALTIDQIAEYCGFGSGSSLARAMAAENRRSPSQIRVRSGQTVGA